MEAAIFIFIYLFIYLYILRAGGKSDVVEAASTIPQQWGSQVRKQTFCKLQRRDFELRKAFDIFFTSEGYNHQA